MKNFLGVSLACLCFCWNQEPVVAQEASSLSQRFEQLMFADKEAGILNVRGHSHNDYEQAIPFLTAYHAGMESIEVDLFLRDDTLYAAHDQKDITVGRTLEKLYLQPLAELYRANGAHPFADTTKNLQLLLDFKEDYQRLMPSLIALLLKYDFLFDDARSAHPVHIVISGNMPAPELFSQFPTWIKFDGRPNIPYTDAQRKHLGMISQDLRVYSQWNGKGEPAKMELQKIMQDAKQAADWGVSFRLWGTSDNVNTWIVLEKMGVTWLNTDHPAQLKVYLDELLASRFQLVKLYPVYSPTYASDGAKKEIRNVILLIGDGMGLGHLQSAIIANRGESNIKQMRHIGFSSTTSYSLGNTDSGAGGTAIATGMKTYNGQISVDTNGVALAAIPDRIRERGMRTGIISTGDASDATPAVFYAKHKNRNASEDITQSLVTNQSIDILIAGRPSPYRDVAKHQKLVTDLAKNDFTLLEDLVSFQQSKAEKLVTFLPDSLTRPAKEGRGPVLSQLVNLTIQKLDKRDKGFFIMAESAQIDYGGHARDLTYVAAETVDFDQAVGEALRFADADGHTLVLVTADHETGALNLLDVDQATGKIQGHFASNDHSSMLVPVLAYGPGAQAFIGFYENTEIFHRLIQLLEKK
ncbi:alkaline phosphatase [Sphingobacterium sp. lm-10]|uniref:alkaline phosphatase n=1 Tax=Sphingobacterium sp. lm-10 TaxID=2944904 RepID=UPI002021FF73|nr:alkaline phosphatase [Sphingobacterium sp. lm-10]MCL7987261.1 alkaline phosphatase [Sphingobacterium sp. lm-10]